MSIKKSPTTRKRFLWWGSAIIAGVAALKWNLFVRAPRVSSASKMKMLTQDGKLVEIDRSLAGNGRRKITNEELQHWVNKEQPKPTDYGK